MKGKTCESNLNTVLCVFLGLLLLIVLWYVVFGKRTIESYAEVVAGDVDDDGDYEAAVVGVNDLLYADPYTVTTGMVRDPAEVVDRRTY